MQRFLQGKFFSNFKLLRTLEDKVGQYSGKIRDLILLKYEFKNKK